MIRAVFMDIDAAAQEGMAHCFEDAGLIYKPEMFSVFKEENDRIWKKIEQGILTMDDLPYVRWQAILKKLGLEADGVAMEMLFRYFTARFLWKGQRRSLIIYRENIFCARPATALMSSRSAG